MQNILVHYAEISLKGKNRPDFIRALEKNIRAALVGLPLARIEQVYGRLLVVGKEPFPSSVLDRLRQIYGIAYFSPVVHVQADMEEMGKAAWELVKDKTYKSFRITARRAFKNLPLPSMEVQRVVGSYLYTQRPTPVQMHGADLDVHIDLMPHGAYIYADKIRGPGGLPVGISGTVGCLLSGGIDSPVAAARMQKRGCKVVFIHFHSYPFHSKASQEKVKILAQHLTRAQQESILFLVPFGELQREIATSAPSSLRVVLYRRFMMRIASELATRQRARALVTGESLGQVASQTLINMVTIDNASSMTIFRPLIAFDKQEIITEAQALGTFETSIIPDQDSCQLFMPSNPETFANLAQVQEAETLLNTEVLCQDAIARTECVQLKASWA
jgi:tRNA uracil 4-sulfurtransferase